MTITQKIPPGLQVKPEKEIIEEAKLNPAAFEPIYNKHFRSIFLFMFKRTNNEGLSSELTSLTFLKAIENIKNYQYKGYPISAWLYRIAYNVLMQQYRDNASGRVISIDDERLDEIGQEINDNDFEDKYELILKAIEQLDEPEVFLLELKYFEKLSNKEIASVLDITEANAKVKIHRLIQKIKSIIFNNKSVYTHGKI